MQTADLEVIKDIPGYKVILKAVLRSQIQQLVEQLAAHTEEESIILTASVSDGTLCHLGSDSGKTFLEDHDDIKSQFLGFCLKRNHRQKQQEKEREEALLLQQQQEQLQQQQQRRFSGIRPGFTPTRSPRFTSRFSPRQPSIHPVALTRASLTGAGVRHSPYPAVRPGKRVSLDQQGRIPGIPNQNHASKMDKSEVIKIEPDDSEESPQSVSDLNNQTAHTAPGAEAPPNSSQPSSPSQSPNSAPSTPSKVKGEISSEKDNAEITESPSAIPNQTFDDTLGDSAAPMGLSLDSDLSNLISGEGLDSNFPQSVSAKTEKSSSAAGYDPNVSVKVEAISESEMELEITGVEPGHVDPMGSQDNWGTNIPGGMGYDPTGATGSQSDLQDSEQGYRGFSVYINKDQESNNQEGSIKHISDLQGPRPPTTIPQVPILASLSTSFVDHNIPKPTESSDGGELSSSFTSQELSTGELILPDPESIGISVKFTCEFCEKKFLHKSYYERHMMMHTGEKPFKCDICGKSFSRKYHLKTHAYTHLKHKCGM